MPATDDVGVELNQYQKEKEEFADAMDDVFSADNKDKTDEEIIDSMNKKDATGESEDDSTSTINSADGASKSSDNDNDDTSDLLSPGQVDTTEDVSADSGNDKPATKDEPKNSDGDTDWKKESESLEAELAKERQKTSSWNGRITAANKKVKDLESKIESLEAKAVAPKTGDAADTTNESDVEVLSRFREDFPEMADVVDIMQKRIDAGKTAPAKDPEPSTTDTETQDHMSAIRQVHPDLAEIVNTGVLLTWINKQPDFIRPTLETIYTSGKSEDVVKMVTEFKQKSGWKSQLAKQDKKTTASKDKLNAMKEVNSESTTPSGKTVDKNNYDQGAKDAGL